MTLRELSYDEYNKHLESFDHSIYQTTSYGKSLEKENYEVLYIGYFDIEKVLALSIIFIKNIDRYKYAYCPRGFIIDYTDYNLLTNFTNEIKKLLSKKGICAIKLCPNIVKNKYDNDKNLIYTNSDYDYILSNLSNLGYRHLGYNNKFEAMKPRYEAIIDLNKPYYEVFKNIQKRYRTKIRSAENMGIRIHKSNESKLDLLYNQSKKKYMRGLEYFNNLYTNFNLNSKAEFYYAKLDINYYLKVMQDKYIKQENIVNELNDKILIGNNNEKNRLIERKITEEKLFNKYQNDLKYAVDINKKNEDIILSTLLVVTHNKDAYVLMDTYDKTFSTMNAKHLLIWKILEKYSQEGYNTINLGGIVNCNDNQDKYYGLTKFKLNFGSMIYEYMGDLELITNKPLYLMYKNSAPLRLLKNKN